MNVIGLFGEITVDLAAARLEPGVTILDLAASCSIVRIVVPDDVAVDMDLRVLLGSVRRDPEVLDAASSPDRPCVRVTGHTLEVDGRPGPWLSRSETLLRSHARWRVGPAASLRRLETAAIVATVGSHDPVLDELVAAHVDGSAEQREWVEDLLAERIAATIRSSETGYRLVRAYCREELGREPDRVRYRVVIRDVAPYSKRNTPADSAELRATTLAWLGTDEFDLLELRAQDYLESYEQHKLVERSPEPND